MPANPRGDGTPPGTDAPIEGTAPGADAPIEGTAPGTDAPIEGTPPGTDAPIEGTPPGADAPVEGTPPAVASPAEEAPPERPVAKTTRERAEAKRQAKLDFVREQVDNGSLVIRGMTDEERERYPPPANPPQRRGWR